ncbi:MAG: hypothetical protein JSW41_02105 [Candidatus Aenigmatarchaeota archaeon]|nr:MAG: hypothetical protein JSW41_02105 [Candidatus Aenigmarchaeota archaeon]
MKLIVFLTVLVVLMPTVQAQTDTYTTVNAPLIGECLDSNVLRISGTFNISGVEVPINTQNITCPDGCVIGAGQYGDDCRFNSSQCYNQELGSLAFSNRFNWGVGGMMMLIGIGIILETYTRGQDKKRRDFFGQPEP